MQFGPASIASAIHSRVEVTRPQFAVATMTIRPSVWLFNPQETAQIVIPGEGADAMLCKVRTDGTDTGTKISGRTVSIFPRGSNYKVMWKKEAPATFFSLGDSLCTRIRNDLALRENELSPQLAVIDPIIWHLGREVRRTLISRIPSTAYLDSIAVVLCQHTLGTYIEQEEVSRSIGALPMYKLRRVVEFIEENLCQNITFRDIAEHVHVSPFHFARVFKLTTGKTPRRFVTERRIHIAKKRLAETDEPIANVAYELGFRSQSHFTSVFSKYVGVTPKAYRRPK
jgi:AraC family transcriptional regulator